MHGCFIFLIKTSLAEKSSLIEKIALLFSGLCHDVAHTGRTNAFEINSGSKFAIRYNDKSVTHYFFFFLSIVNLRNYQKDKKKF